MALFLMHSGYAQDTTLISKGASWKYNDSGSNLGTTWKETNYDDSGWSTNSAELGFGDGQTSAITNHAGIQYYFRKTFQIDEADDIWRLNLGVQRDDGVVVYINGSEAFRSNMPAGVISYNTVASSSVSGSDETTFFMTTLDASTYLVDGTNHIAVEIHQRSAGSSDVRFDLELTADRISENFIEFGNRWKYDDNGSSLGTAWQATGYDDSSWPSGDAELGFGDGDEETEVGDHNDVTYYFRKSFYVPDALMYDSLDLSFIRDDGAVIYLNGVELTRSNMPAGAISFSTLASSNVSGSSETTVRTARVDAGSLVSGVNVIAVEIHQDNPYSSDISFDFELTGRIAVDDFIQYGDVWKYDDNGSSLGTAWQATGYDDSSWPSGNAELGFGDGDEETEVDDHDDVTYYFRKSFYVSNASLYDSLELNFIRDDGAVIYLNGVEITRSNMPDGTISFSTLASSNVSGSSESKVRTARVDAVNLISGVNVIAVEIHQDNPSSSDISFDLELVGILLPQNVPFGFGAEWKYDDGGVSLGTTWKDSTYDDSAWSSGNGQLGFGDGDETETITDHDDVTYYFRKTFNVVDASLYSSIDLSFIRDDGAVIYLNGVEQTRSNMPGGAIGFSTLASSNVSGSSESTVYTASVPSTNLVSGQNVIAVEVHQDNPSSSDISFDMQLELILEGEEPLFTYGSNWNYDDSGANLGTSWKDTTYDDSAWSSGYAELGFGDGDETKVITNHGGYTYYFRSEFSLTSIDSSKYVRVNLKRDDGAIVYMNGTEVFRTNMPSGAVAYNEGASGFCGDDGEDEQSTVFASNNLKVGRNVIAVEVHQNSTGSSDVTMDLELEYTELTERIVRGPYLNSGTQTSTIVKWRTEVPIQSYVYYGTDYNSYSDTVFNTEAVTDHELTISGLSPNTKYYYAVGTADTMFYPNSSNSYFYTAPVSSSTELMRAWVLGDAGTANDNQRAVRDAYYDYVGENYTDMMLMLGDNAYNDGTDAQYQDAMFEDMYEDMLRKTIVWSCPGNHEFYNGETSSATQTGPYFDIFSFPTAGEAGGVASGTEAYYSWDYGQVHFISLDSERSSRDTTGAMYTWLKSDLADTDKKWIIGIFHHPPYTKGSHDSDNVGDSGGRMRDMRENFLPLLERFGVDVVLSGHSHSYERSYFLNGHYDISSTYDSTTMAVQYYSGKDDEKCAYRKTSTGADAGKGAVYLTAGSSGKTSGLTRHPAIYAYLNELGSVVIEIEKNQLNLKFINSDSNVSDYFTIDKDVKSTSIDTTASNGVPITLTASWEGSYDWEVNGATTQSLVVTVTSDTSFVVNSGNGCYSDTFNVSVMDYIETEKDTISGIVFLDLDISKTYTSEDKGQGAMEVVAYQDINLNGNIDLEDPLIASYLSDGDGRYDLAVNPPQVQSLSSHCSSSSDDASEDFDDSSVTINNTSLNSLSVSSSSILFDSLSNWHYLDDGSDLGTTWLDTTYNFASWSNGNGNLGFGEVSTTTTLTSGHITYYFLKEISLSSIAEDIKSVTMEIKVDDGFVMYVNGAEVFRRGMPEGEITSNTESIKRIDGQYEKIYNTYTFAVSNFVEGRNVIAIEVHQFNRGSSDVTMDMRLEANEGENNLLGLRFDNIDIPKNAQIVDAWLNLTPSSLNSNLSTLVVKAEAADNAAAFTTAAGNISSRSMVPEEVYWRNERIFQVDREFSIPGLTGLVQSVIDRGGWSSGNALALIVNGSPGTFYSFEGNSIHAPELIISYLDTNATSIQYVVTVKEEDFPEQYAWMTSSVQTVTNSISARTSTEDINFGYIGSTSICFAHAEDGFNTFNLFNRFSGKNKIFGDRLIGHQDIEAMAFNRNSDSLFAANGAQLGLIDKNDGSFTALPFAVGSGDGAAGNHVFSDIDGLSYDLINNILWGSERRPGSDKDLLVKINPKTGALIEDAFGAGVEYVLIDGPGVFGDIDDIAVSPTSGALFAMNNSGGAVTSLIRIDSITGAGTVINTTSFSDLEGQSFHNDGTLYTTSGRDGDPKNSIYQVDLNNASLTYIGTFVDYGDYESCACLSGPIINFIDGYVYEDIDKDAIFTDIDFPEAGVLVYLYKDEDNNGVLSRRPAVNDSKIDSTTTDSTGYFAFRTSLIDSFVVVPKYESMPETAVAMTTDSMQNAAFRVGGSVDLFNNFGYTNDFLLPVTLLSFSGEQSGAQNYLYWSTSTEVNSSHFEIQRSFDGVNYEIIGTTDAKGNGSEISKYQFVDETPLSGTNYYRLRSVDYDGSSYLSKSILLQNLFNQTKLITSLVPNPAKNMVTIGFENLNTLSKGVMISVRDFRGQMVLQAPLDKKIDQLQLNLSQFQTGIYFIHVESEMGVDVLKLIKQ